MKKLLTILLTSVLALTIINVRNIKAEDVKVTFVWSSIDIDNEKPVEDYVIENVGGKTILNVIRENLTNIGNHFSSPGYQSYLFSSLEAYAFEEISSLSSQKEVVDATNEVYNTVLTESKTVYVLKLKEIDKLNFKLEEPVVGTEVTTTYDEEKEIYIQTNSPKVLVDDKEAKYSLYPNEGSYFGTADDGYFSGTIQNDSEYKVEINIVADFGYCISEEPETKTNIGQVISSEGASYLGQTIIKVNTDHEWQFVDFTWNGYESAKANYKCANHDDATKSIDDVTITKTVVQGKNNYTATVNKADSLDGEEHKGTKETVDLTIRWSSMDGVDLMEPLVLKDLKPGIILEDALKENGKDAYEDIFKKEGYMDSWYRTLNPYTEYNSWGDIIDEDDDERAIDENTVLYEIIHKEIDSIELSITIPNVGVSTTTQPSEGGRWNWKSQTNKPEVSCDNKLVEISDTYWDISPEDNNTPFIGEFEAGKTYTAEITVEPKIGYCFSRELNVKANGDVKVEEQFEDEATIFVNIKVEEHNYNVEKNTTITEWYKGSNTNGKFVFKRSISDEVTYDRFTGIEVDGNKVPKSNYTKKEGSVIIELNSKYLETLSVGEHTLTALFTDGSVDTKFKVISKTNPSEDNTPRRVIPNTSSK